MAIKEISVTLINRQRRVDCLVAIGPPFFLTKQSPHHQSVLNGTKLYSRIYSA